ncbi:MAG: histidine--tRNA ligase [Treponema sp.]|nr:histidine--tRNA ligase [Treponema sp.]
MSDLIQPKVLKGFRDILPAAEIQRSDLTEKITQIYRSFGFVPIDTPVLEYTQILLRKSNGETEKQVFRFEDNGGRDVAMRFDLTVPFARFTAEHYSELYMPFKRYHIAKVWRGEKPQAGRYREFVQCDIDMVGSDTAAADFEILNVLQTALYSLKDIPGYETLKNHKITMCINHRGLLNRFLAKIGLQDKSTDILAWIDKLPKQNEEAKTALREGRFADVEVGKELLALTSSEEFASEIFEFIDPKDSFEATLKNMEEMAGGPAEDSKRLRDIYNMMCAAGIQNAFKLDPAITRGLDYYTGVVFETFVEGMNIGSVCSGGRYDNLAGLYMKEKVPGVGGSIGLDRLIAGLEVLGITKNRGSYLDVEIFCQNNDHMTAYQKLAADLRKNGIAVEVFPEAKKMNQQYNVTEAKNVEWGILMNEEDVKNGTFTLKNLKTREMKEKLSVAEAVKIIGE